MSTRTPNAKLTASQVTNIRARAKSGAKQSDLAKEYGISEAAVSLIVNGKTWGDAA